MFSLQYFYCSTVVLLGIGWIVAYVVNGPTSAVTEGRVLVHLRYCIISYNCTWRVNNVTNEKQCVILRIHFFSFIRNFCRIMQKQMGWNTYVLIVVLRISRKNKVLQMGILKGQCCRDSFDVVSSAPSGIGAN